MGLTNTRPASIAFLERFEREVLAAAETRGETLTPYELARRVRSARRGYFQKLSLKSSIARSRRKPSPDEAA